MITAIQTDFLADAVPSYRAGTAAGVRRNASDTSRAAADRTNEKHYDRKVQVLTAVMSAGRGGLTCRELAARWNVGMNTISGRFTQLRDGGHIMDGGKRREGCTVWIAANASSNTSPVNSLTCVMPSTIGEARTESLATESVRNGGTK